MAKLTNNRADGRQEGVLVDVLHNGNKIFAGGAVTIGSNGYANAGVAGQPFVGVAAEETPADIEYIRVYVEGVFDFNCLAAVGVQANVGAFVKLTDDNTVALGEQGDVLIGQITNINNTTSVRVKLVHTPVVAEVE